MESNRKERIGSVISNKMEKTVVVQVEDTKRHPIYRKVLTRRVNFKAHDENKECGPGDVVRIVETRPLSKDKRWRVAEILRKKEVAEIEPKEVV
ncbi:MAG TPA: 30S ribosomal protein S17 [Dehalococcoidia bacterium]|nr:30S ribosomal protein S17 [Dehalococcoidia bacterium]